MTDLTNFLLERIAEDEKVARAAYPSQWYAVGEPSKPMTKTSRRTPSCAWPRTSPVKPASSTSPAMTHAACWPSARPTRRIVERIVANDDGTVTPQALIVGDDVVRLLALPYADHPDFREEWARGLAR